MASDLASALLSGDSAGFAANPALAEILPRYRLAQALTEQGLSTAPAHPVQAAARLVQALVGGNMQRETGDQLKGLFEGNQQQFKDFAGSLPGLDAPKRSPLVSALTPPQPAPTAPVAPAQATPNSRIAGGFDALNDDTNPQPSPMDTAQWPVGPVGAPSPQIASDQPRGIRNNNPLNIEAGSFTAGQPGVSGSDGRFARFATPEAGVQAAAKLIDVYKSKHGLNTIAGIVGRWAPAGDGNNVGAYAQSVARQMGVDPNQPLDLDNPATKSALIAAMGQHENGRPIQVASNDPAQAMAFAAPDQPQRPPGAPQQQQAQLQLSPQNAQPAQAPGGGIPPDMAAFIRQAIANPNPQIRKYGMDLYQQYIAPPKFEEIGVDDYGNKRHGFVQAATQNVVPYNANASSGATGGSPGSILRSGGGIEAIPEGLRGTVKQMLDGRVAPPTGAALRNPQILRLMDYANSVDPSFDTAKWTMRYNAAKDESSSNSQFSRAITSSGQIINHAAQLHDLIDKLPNVDQAWVNPFTQGFKDIIGDKEFKDTRGRYGQVKQSIAGELEKLMRGSAGASKEIQERLHALDIAKSPTELHAAVDEILSLMEGRLGPVVDIHNKAFDKTREPTEFLDPKAQKVLQRIREQGISRASGAEPAPSTSTPAIAPQTKSIGGKTYIKQGDQWFEQ